MQLRMYALVEIDPSTAAEKAILEVLEPEIFPKEIKISGKALMHKVPSQIAWFVKDGIHNYDLLIQVPAKDEVEK